jgi:hypothetical protein
MEEFEIYCPKCGWRPGPQDRWMCTPACGTIWNTFWTRGMCPSCAKVWRETQCLACAQLSPHKQWYHVPGRTRDGDQEKRELETSS